MLYITKIHLNVIMLI